MGIFGRRKDNPATSPADLDEELVEEVDAGPPPGVPGVDRDWVREVDGPFDVTERGAEDDQVNLGALRVPAVRGMELRLDVEQGSGKVIGVTCGMSGSRAQLQVFAAPKSSGIWKEIRTQIAESVVAANGTAEVTDGPMGQQILARMPGRSSDGRVAFQPARFVGVDGPRWFLRAVINGAAASDEEQFQAMLDLLRQVVVVRGDEPRPPREVLHLDPPAQVMEALSKRAAAAKAAQQGEAAQQGGAAQTEATQQAGAAPQAEPEGTVDQEPGSTR